MKISICVTTYNVAPYIRQCLDSVLMQKLDIPYKIIVVDDCSTDETASILKEYGARFPAVFQLHFNEANLRSCRNSLKAWSLADSDFISILDGDDYWTDKDKLQKQVNALKENQHAVMCHHDGYIEDATGKRKRFNRLDRPAEYEIDLLLTDTNIWNSSVVYRNVLHGQYPDWMNNLIHHDHTLHLLHALHGSILYIDEPLGIYRIHETNTSKKWIGDRATEFSRTAIYACNRLKKEMPRKYHAVINLGAARHYDLIAGHYWKKHAFIKFFFTVLRGYLLCPLRSIREYKDSYYHLFRQP
ncbi:MAG: glycosyltransferase [Chitinophagales bacterium]|nr:glycosyltransferase [Chitinophagales bacterium]